MGLDLEIFGQPRALDAPADPVRPKQALKRLRDSHHLIARLFAAGLRPEQVSLQTTYSLGRLAALTADPSFQELVSFYVNARRDVVEMVEEKLKAVGMDFVQEAHERLLEGEEIPMETVLAGAKLFLDRAGFAPVQRSTSKNLNVNIGARMDELAREMEAAQERGLEPKLIEAADDE